MGSVVRRGGAPAGVTLAGRFLIAVVSGPATSGRVSGTGTIVNND